MPQDIPQIPNLPPGNIWTVLGFPIVRDVPGRFAYYLKEAFKSRTSGDLFVHLVEGFALEELPNVDNAVLDIL